jgi:hypothetical protein
LGGRLFYFVECVVFHQIEMGWQWQALLGPSRRGLFDVRLFYNILFPIIVLISFGGVFGGIRFLWEVAFFVWSAALGKIPTLDNLRKRHIIVVDWCCLCKKSGETIDYFLLHFEITSVLCNSIFDLFGLEQAMPWGVVDLFACWRGQFGSLQSVPMWKMISSCLMWCIWRERNDQSFEDLERMGVELNAFFFNFHWMNAYDWFHISSFHDSLDFFFFFWWVVSLVYFLCTWVVAFCVLMNFNWLLKKDFVDLC